MQRLFIIYECLGKVLYFFPILHLGQFIAFVGKLFMAGLNTVAIFVPAFGFLLVIGYLVTNVT
jgi:hypothetical protein